MKKENTINSYGYAVFTSCHNKPLHVVEINHCLCVSFSVFSNAKDARNYILAEKESLKELKYDPDFTFHAGLLEMYKTAKAGLFSKLENHAMYINA